MNRTEAIEILENWLSSSRRTEKRLGYINGWFYEEDEEAFRMAHRRTEQGRSEDGSRGKSEVRVQRS